MKSARQLEILKLIQKYQIETQEDLADRLNESGFSVTQATVSRDIRDMKLTKMPGENGILHYVQYAEPETRGGSRFVRVLRDAFVSMEPAQNILVIKTEPGMAMAAAAVLDEMNWPEVVGCIAGDNTIMCAIRTGEETLSVMTKLRAMLRED